MKIITQKDIENDFEIVDSIFGDLKNYHKEIEFAGYGKFCDVYFLCEEKPNQNQIDTFNKFVENYVNKLDEVEELIIKNLNLSDPKKIEKVKKCSLYLDIISIPENSSKYDLVIVCSKTYKSMYIFNKTVNIRIEYKNGQVISSKVKNNTTEDNS